MRFDIITIFPDMFFSYLNEGIISRAIKTQAIEIYKHNPRDFTKDKHRTVDDAPFGGGVGMIMKIEPLYECLNSIPKMKKHIIILLSASGDIWKQASAHKYTQTYDQIILICGRYEGIDERIKTYIHHTISIGEYVLTGGELPALILIDSLTRLLPGVLGKDESNIDESHSTQGYLEYPHYTRPQIFTDNEKNNYAVPDVLISGNHAEIKKWRQKMSIKKTDQQD